MEFKQIVKNRYSVRQYQAKAVPEETIDELLELISFSVSAINMQPWKIKVVADQKTKDELFPATFGMTQVMACSHLLGLGACPMTAFRPDEFARILGLPDAVVPTVLVSVGYPADGRPAPKLRYPVSDIVV